MNDYIREEERIEIEDKVRSVDDWSYTITTTLAEDDVTLAQVWMHNQQGIDRLVRNDARAVYVLFTCINRDSPRHRPHGHGLIRTTLPLWKVQKLFWGHGTKVKPVSDVVGWLDYCTSQAIRDVTLHNIEETAYATTES